MQSLYISAFFPMILANYEDFLFSTISTKKPHRLSCIEPGDSWCYLWRPNGSHQLGKSLMFSHKLHWQFLQRVGQEKYMNVRNRSMLLKNSWATALWRDGVIFLLVGCKERDDGHAFPGSAAELCGYSVSFTRHGYKLLRHAPQILHGGCQHKLILCAA